MALGALAGIESRTASLATVAAQLLRPLITRSEC